MKKSQKISLIASFAYVIVATILILMVTPLLDWKIGSIPGMTYVVMFAALLCPIICWIIVPKVEKMEEEENRAEGKKGD
ncbi:MAG: hypothetical protein ACOYIE_08770 [Agathobaculum sp.]|jgi:antibiotic biosynthesis monooxygenase (ABM) superfamily enzyme|uniref:hypothetical protein n=1 Tax=Agathobaculum sp. TaxID=2048138 RepID=UPI003D8EF2DB